MENITLENIIKTITEKGLEYIPKILLSVLVLWLGFKLIGKLLRFVDKSFSKVFDDTIRPFVISLVGFVLKGVLILVIAGFIGFNLAGLLGLFAAIAFAVGMALQGSLGNFASGILILTFKPYRVGEWIDLDGKFGIVENIGIFSTIIESPGRKTLIIPNSKVTEGIVTNYSKKGMVRLEIGVKMPYSEDFPKVQDIIKEAIGNVENILEEPKTEIGIENFDSHSISLTIRPYVKPENFWKVTFDTHKAVKKAFSENNIQVAYSEGVEMGSIGK